MHRISHPRAKPFLHMPMAGVCACICACAYLTSVNQAFVLKWPKLTIWGDSWIARQCSNWLKKNNQCSSLHLIFIISLSKVITLLQFYIVNFLKQLQSNQGHVQDLVKGASDKLPPTLSNCYCCLTSPFFHKKRYDQDICSFSAFNSGFDRTNRTTPWSTPANYLYNATIVFCQHWNSLTSYQWTICYTIESIHFAWLVWNGVYILPD